jgi:hypothetical protein
VPRVVEEDRPLLVEAESLEEHLGRGPGNAVRFAAARRLPV